MVRYLVTLAIFLCSTLGALVASEETVVCVHGLFRTRCSMLRVASSLKKTGWEVVNWGYPSRRYTVEEHADHLVARLNCLARQRPGKPISFVTHSLGGLIVRAAVTHPDCPDEAKQGRAVLLAPPNRGSAFARYLHRFPIARLLLGNKVGQQFMTFGPDAFEKLGTFPTTMKILVIAGNGRQNRFVHEESDGTVAITETRLSTDHQHVILPVGHTWIAWSPKVIEHVQQHLEDATP